MFHVKHLPVFVLLSVIVLASPLPAEESWILPVDDLAYRRAEELFLLQRSVPPFEETPVIADDLRSKLDALIERTDDGEIAERAGLLREDLKLPFPVISPILEVGLSGGLNTETDRAHYIDSNAGGVDHEFLDYLSMYEINEVPAVLKIGFILQSYGFSMMFQPELSESIGSKFEDYDFHIGIPTGFASIDDNFPYRGIATFFHSPVELRFGRDKLNLGPGRWSTLTLTKHMPYFDYAKARFFYDWVSFSWYYIRLNPTINEEEGEYLDDVFEGSIPNPEPHAELNGKPFVDRSKHYIVGKLVVQPLSWLSLSVAQTNLVGGRDPQLTDFNPLIILHNTYAEGVYSVPLSVTATVVPYRGLKIYFDYLFYDAVAGDESDPSANPGASAYQVGFTLLSDPFFKLWGGRFRLDGELSYVDPWTYGKYYSLRQFTSRIIYIEHFGGRSWVDYPLGFYLGPDSIDLHVSLAYGIPGDREVELHYNRRGIGQIDMYGFGDENDYAHAGEPGYPLGGAPTGTAEWIDEVELSFYWVPLRGLTLETWYRIKSVTNRFNIDGDNGVFHYLGISGVWKIF